MPELGWLSPCIVTIVRAMETFASLRQAGWIGDFTGSGDDAADE